MLLAAWPKAEEAAQVMERSEVKKREDAFCVANKFKYAFSCIDVQVFVTSRITTGQATRVRLTV